MTVAYITNVNNGSRHVILLQNMFAQKVGKPQFISCKQVLDQVLPEVMDDEMETTYCPISNIHIFWNF